jgi:exopolysaccharide production protein ExoY
MRDAGQHRVALLIDAEQVRNHAIETHDELPQLINIVRGEMSIVGPRPVVQDELELYDQAAVYYLQSRPGLTGLWQISGRNDVSYAARVAFDTHYVQNWSMLSDFSIVVKTIPAVCFSRGSY